jgi:membrane fusion protein, multidrug efflux system
MRATHSAAVRLALFLAATAVSLGCSGGGAPAAPGARPAAEAVAVTVGVASERSVPVQLQAIGTAQAYSVVAVRSQVTGELMAVNFKEGEEVQQGRVLFTLDRRPLEATLRQAQANLARNIAQAANARASAMRYRDLLARGIAPREQADQADAEAAALDAAVDADRAAVESAEVQLQFATISARVSGRTGALMVHPGNLVRANDENPLVVISQVAPIYVSFAIPESRLPELKQYLAKGTVRLEANPPDVEEPPSLGRVTFVDSGVDPTTGTITVKGEFPNADRRLSPGQFLNVVVTLATEANAVVVPTAAVQSGQQGSYVFVVAGDQTADLRTVTLGRETGNHTVVIKGVKPGETVVTDGQLRLTQGSRISVKPAPAAGGGL